MDGEGNALDVILGTIHEKMLEMQTMCIDIMQSNMDLVREIAQLRAEMDKIKGAGP